MKLVAITRVELTCAFSTSHQHFRKLRWSTVPGQLQGADDARLAETLPRKAQDPCAELLPSQRQGLAESLSQTNLN